MQKESWQTIYLPKHQWGAGVQGVSHAESCEREQAGRSVRATYWQPCEDTVNVQQCNHTYHNDRDKLVPCGTNLDKKKKKLTKYKLQQL